MQVRAQVSLSGQASCSSSRAPSCAPRRVPVSGLASLHQSAPRIQRSCTVRAEQEKGALSVVVDKVKEAVGAVEEIVDENILDYCSLDKLGGRPKGRKTLGEKEQDFLDALRAYYFDETPTMSNEEFDMLRAELYWAGSKIAILSTTEQKFLEASLAYQAGKPIVDDEQYDKLKAELRKKNSIVVQQGPRCSIRSRKLYSDATPDYVKMTLLNLPAALVTLLLLFSVDDLTGFEITKLVELPDPWGIVAVWGLVLPLTYILSSSLTNVVLRDSLILKGPCPNCGKETQQYFGDILTIKGSRDKNTVECGNCKAKIEFNAESRTMVVAEPPGSSGPPANARKQPRTA